RSTGLLGAAGAGVSGTPWAYEAWKEISWMTSISMNRRLIPMHCTASESWSCYVPAIPNTSPPHICTSGLCPSA
ncbi:MAG: hypothetical protein K2X29_08160, partial [Candidatus Obscuribacterales bacterium]|nr:hypothetical protein [Candidatus Obscuribacterales bacterium]